MDLEHAHAIEYSLPAEIGQVQSYKSRSNQASTFRGTLKLEWSNYFSYLRSKSVNYRLQLPDGVTPSEVTMG